ncbi:type II secretion system F family protein [Pseudoalteromonas sp. T1lg23B]|uniref:type II secretion system F family protein n=1 Tax=Pseudoalteromonas sp. T1lg23B TaxID=2077097 RepID=UPI000CF646C0|nr:type II secretion system F family protein [Pseudoalteromonas sp. T1lg23B]
MSQVFKYKACNAGGEVERGEITAENEAAAHSALKSRNLLILELKQDSARTIRKRVSLNELEQSTSQLSTLLHNGLRVDKALEVLAQSNRNSALGQVWSLVLNEIKQGAVLSDALASRPDIFSTLYIEMVRIGEATGNLPQVFSRLSQNLEFQSALRSKVIQASTYPLFILIVCVTAIWAIFNFVIPSMSSMFDNGAQVPQYTQLLLDMSSWVQNYQLHLLISILLAGVALYSALQKASLRASLFASVIRFPIVKQIVNHSDRIKFSTALQLTLESGVSLSDSLELAMQTVANPTLQAKLGKVATVVSSGGVLSHELKHLGLYDEVAVSLVTVGEESGSLASSFNEIAKRSRNSFESWLTKFTALLEPLLILIMGGVVGSVVIIMLLSIVSMNDVSF